MPPKILYVCSCWPYDRSYGGQLRALHVGRALKAVGEVSLALVGADKVGDASMEKTAKEWPIFGEWSLRPSAIRGAEALIRTFVDSDYVNIHGHVMDPKSEAEFVSLAYGKFDLIWFYNVRTANYFRRACWSRSVLDIGDFPSHYRASSSGKLSNGAGTYLRAKVWSSALRMHERRLSNRFDVLAVCSHPDKEQLGGDPAIHVIPNGFERPDTTPSRSPSDPPRIGFIGLLDYEPNRDGVRWFLEHCWPALHAEMPGLIFRLAGKGAEDVLDTPTAGVEVLGWVDDAAAEIATWSLMVIPIRSGAGTRIKISDTFSRQCPAVSTSLGAYGYDLTDGRQLRLADTPESFTAACLDLLRNPDEARAMALRAWEEFLERWTWDAIAPSVWSAVEAGLRKPANKPAG